MTLVEFLLARIEEDYVKRVTMREWHASDCESVPAPGSEYTYPCDCGVPERVAVECDAKRRIIALHCEGAGGYGDNFSYCECCYGVMPETWAPDCLAPGQFLWPCETLQILALPYADHPDYLAEWRL